MEFQSSASFFRTKIIVCPENVANSGFDLSIVSQSVSLASLHCA
jgi:hypothetical protein